MSDEMDRYRRDQASAYLVRVRAAKRHIASLRAVVDEQRSLAAGLQGIDYERPVARSHPDPDGVPDAVIRLMDAIERFCEEMRGYSRMLDECGAALRAMDGTSADIIRYRYICDYPWERIAAETHYSEQWLYELHNRALSEFYDWMPAHERDPLPRAV